MRPKSQISNQPFNPLLWPRESLPFPWVEKAQKQQKDPQNPRSGRKSSGKVSAEPQPSLSSPAGLSQAPIPASSQTAPALLLLLSWEWGCPERRALPSCFAPLPGKGFSQGLFPRALPKSFSQEFFPRALQVPGSRGSPAPTLPNWGQLQTAQSPPFPILPGWETGLNSFLWSGMFFPSSASHPLPWTWRVAPKFGFSGTLGALWISKGSPPGRTCDPQGHLWNEGLQENVGAQDGAGPGVQESPFGEEKEEFGKGKLTLEGQRVPQVSSKQQSCS